MADVFIQTKNSTSVVSILDTTLQLPSSSIDVPILSDNHKEITNVNMSVSHPTSTRSKSNITSPISNTMDRPNLAAPILSPVPMLSSPTAHVPSPIATIVSSPSLATQVSSPIAVQVSSQNATHVSTPVIASLIPTAEIVTSTPRSIIPVDTPRNTSLSIKVPKTPKTSSALLIFDNEGFNSLYLFSTKQFITLPTSTEISPENKFVISLGDNKEDKSSNNDVKLLAKSFKPSIFNPPSIFVLTSKNA
jgi:hypothetical protein